MNRAHNSVTNSLPDDDGPISYDRSTSITSLLPSTRIATFCITRPPSGQLRAPLGRQIHSIHFAIPPASSMTFLASAYAFWHRAQAAKGRRRLEHAGLPVHPHAGDGGGQEQVDVLREAQGPWGLEDDVAGDRRRLLASVHHVVRLKIGRAASTA